MGWGSGSGWASNLSPFDTGSWSGGIKAGGAAAGYSYGWPAGGTAEPNVAAQWIFDEASGDIVDEVAGITLADVGTPTYNVAFTGLYAGLSPGITTDDDPSYFHLDAPVAGLDLGTNDAVFELWVQNAAQAAAEYFIDTIDDTTNFRGYTIYVTSDPYLVCRVKASNGDYIQVTKTVSAWAGADPHKFRIVLNRSGNLEIFQDGVSKGTGSASAISGDTVNCNTVHIGTRVNHSSRFTGTFLEVRITIGNSTNNSGGPNGG